MASDYAIVVFSHLRWDFVFQRPQHLLSRLAVQHPVIFFEEPVHTDDPVPSWELSTPADNVLVCRLHTNVESGSFSDAQAEILAPMVSELLAGRGIQDYVLWLYTPMALRAARRLQPRAVVFDCMDELSAFRFAPPALLERESELLKWADLVFTGGPSLYEAKKGRNPNVYLFPSSVDAAHFGQARSVPEPPEQRDLPHPRLGFYGVIDERLDLELLDQLAASHPDWQIVIVGPVVKIEPSTLPQHPNLHYMGQRTYNELPAFLAGWDVCLLPFARNESTKFISPTKILEYMAAELPIVSTPITDVARPYGHIVYLATTPAEFVAACEQALTDGPDEQARRIAGMREVLANTSWDNTVQSMEQLIDKAVEKSKGSDLVGRRS